MKVVQKARSFLHNFHSATRIDVYETLCPIMMHVHKGGKIKNWGGECRDVTPTKSLSQNIRVDVNREMKFCENSKKKNIFFVGGGGGGSFCENSKKKYFFCWRGGGGGSGRGCSGGGHRVDVNKELKFV